MVSVRRVGERLRESGFWWGTGLFLLALGLRVPRVSLRFNQISFAYAAYYEPVVSAWERGDLLTVATRFIGLHPPLYSMLFTFLYEVWGALMAYHLFSALLSSLAVPVLYRAGREAFGERVGRIAAFLLATSVYAQHYSLEINNYPLLQLVSSLMLWAAVRAIRRPQDRAIALLGLMGTVGIYTHALLGPLFVLLMAALLVSRSSTVRAVVVAVGVSVVLSLPLFPGYVELMGNSGTYQNERVEVLEALAEVGGGMASRFGYLPARALVAVAALVGVIWGLAIRRERAVTLTLVTTLLMAPLVMALVVATVASSSQYPYYLVLVPSSLLLAARGFGGKTSGQEWEGNAWLRGLLLAGVGSAQIAVTGLEVSQARAAADAFWQRPHALSSGALEGDVLWLVSPALRPDDDKLAADPAYLALDPWVPCRYAPPYSFEYVDYEYGQPYQCGKRVLHTFTDIYPQRMKELLAVYQERGLLVDIVIYPVSESEDLIQRLEVLWEDRDVRPRKVGDSLWYRVEP